MNKMEIASKEAVSTLKDVFKDSKKIVVIAFTVMIIAVMFLAQGCSRSDSAASDNLSRCLCKFCKRKSGSGIGKVK